MGDFCKELFTGKCLSGRITIIAMLVFISAINLSGSITVGAVTWIVLIIFDTFNHKPDVLEAKAGNLTVREFEQDLEQDDVRAWPGNHVLRWVYVNDAVVITQAGLNGTFFFMNWFALSPEIEVDTPGSLGDHIIAWYELILWLYFLFMALTLFAIRGPYWRRFFVLREMGSEVAIHSSSLMQSRLHHGHRLAACAYYFHKCGTFSALSQLKWVKPLIVVDHMSRDGTTRIKWLLRSFVGLLMGGFALRHKVIVLSFLARENFVYFPGFSHHELHILTLSQCLTIVACFNNFLNIFDLVWMRIDLTVQAHVRGTGSGETSSAWLHRLALFFSENGRCTDWNVLEKLWYLDQEEVRQLFKGFVSDTRAAV